MVDVPRILAGDASADVLLQDGDELIVPKLVESITVAGEVYEPGSFRFEQGLSVHRLSRARCGYTDRARKKDIYVIEPNGAVVQVKRSKRQLFRFDQSGCWSCARLCDCCSDELRLRKTVRPLPVHHLCRV